MQKGIKVRPLQCGTGLQAGGGGGGTTAEPGSTIRFWGKNFTLGLTALLLSSLLVPFNVQVGIQLGLLKAEINTCGSPDDGTPQAGLLMELHIRAGEQLLITFYLAFPCNS